jgi:hypothetical protein
MDMDVIGRTLPSAMLDQFRGRLGVAEALEGFHVGEEEVEPFGTPLFPWCRVARGTQRNGSLIPAM